ncbi:hypothetical protein [Bacteroides sp. 519]|uniref:hypothetical protein n=1 Tax=Bacteroides sp. 519 TaxID=2302937 RepID=UPI0013D48E53|nr:hypothetical protein [Bacteroides sp. 519]
MPFAKKFPISQRFSPFGISLGGLSTAVAESDYLMMNLPPAEINPAGGLDSF